MVHRYKLAVNKSRQRETTRWHYAKLKHAMDNPEAELKFENDLQQSESQKINQRSTGQDVEAACFMLAQEINGLAKKYFAANKGPREQWLSENTWEMMRNRTWLVDSLRNETDSAQVSTEVVRLSREIRKSCRRDKKQRIDRLCGMKLERTEMEKSVVIVRLCMARCRRAKRSCAYNFSRCQGRLSLP